MVSYLLGDNHSMRNKALVTFAFSRFRLILVLFTGIVLLDVLARLFLAEYFGFLIFLGSLVSGIQPAKSDYLLFGEDYLRLSVFDDAGMGALHILQKPV